MKPLTKRQEGQVQSWIDQMDLKQLIGQLNNPNTGSSSYTGAAGGAENIEEAVRKGLIGSIGHESPENAKELQRIAIEESPLGIPLIFSCDTIHGYRTVFPNNMGSAWNPELWEEVTRLAAAEARLAGVHTPWAPMSDVVEDDRWGRTAELGIESPWLAAQVVRAMVKGFQGDSLARAYTLAACAKHIGGYGFAIRGGEYKEVRMGPNDFWNKAMPPFIAAAEEEVSGYMLGFHTVDRDAMTSSRALGTILEKLLRHKEGMIATDFSASMELVNHGVAPDLKEAAWLTFKYGRATTDLVSQAYIRHLEELVDEGRIDRREIEDRVRKILNLKVRLFWDEDKDEFNPYIDFNRMQDTSDQELPEESRALARRAVQETVILLKNEGNVLPLSKAAKVGIIGPLGGGEPARRNMRGTWAVRAVTDDHVTLEEGMKNVAGTGAQILFAKGANLEDNPSISARYDVHDGGHRTAEPDARTPEDMLAEAEAVAAQSDVLLMALGEPKEATGESSSCYDTDLSESQFRLLKRMREVADEQGKKLVVMMMSGRYKAMGRVEKLADAIVLGHHGGVEAGNGYADILYGDVNPSGKTTRSIARHSGQNPITHEELPTGRPVDGIGNLVEGDMEAVKVVGGRKVSVVYKDKEKLKTDLEAGIVEPAFVKFTNESNTQGPDSPLYPFGFGKSYTTYEYGPVEVSKLELGPDDVLELSVKVRNTGKMIGRETVQVYFRQAGGSIFEGRLPFSHPKKQLIASDKKEIAPGEEETFKFKIGKRALSYIFAETMIDVQRRFEPGPFKIMVGPNAGDVETVDINWKGGGSEILPLLEPSRT